MYLSYDLFIYIYIYVYIWRVLIQSQTADNLQIFWMIQLQFMRDCRSNNQTQCEMHYETDGKPIFAWHVRKFCRTTCSRSALLSHVSSSSPTWGRPNLDRRSGRPHSWKILGILWVMRLHLTPCFWLWDHLTRKLFKQSTLKMGWILGQSKETASNMSNVQPRI